MLDPKTMTYVQSSYSSLYQAAGLPIHSLEGCLYSESGAPSPFLNGVLELPKELSDTSISAIIDHYKQKDLPHCWVTLAMQEPKDLPLTLAKFGLKKAGDFPAMLLDISQVKAPTQNDLTMELIESEKQLKNWSQIITQAWQFQEPTTSIYSSIFRKAGLGGPLYHLMGNGTVAGTLLVTEQGGYIYNISSTVTGKGYASQMLYALVMLAKEKGLKQCALVSNAGVEPLYQKLGFRSVDLHHIYF